MEVIKVNSSVLNFEKDEEGKPPKANFEITNLSDSGNIAFKIKTTSPKLFVVKPIQGILAPSRSINVEI
jgi:hypothetical protein